MTVTNFYNDGGIYNEIIINGDNAVIHANEKKPLTGAVEEAEAEEEACEPLSRFIPNRQKVNEYASALHQCQSAKEVAFVVKDMYDQHLENDAVIVSKGFLEVIQSYVKCSGNSVNNLRDFIKKIALGL